MGEICFIEFPATRLTVGAQASDPDAPNYDAEALPDEGPVREVDVASFWMMRDELPRIAYRACADAGFCTDAAEVLAYSITDLLEPARKLSWHDAVQICAFLGARLPTEAEWDVAARGAEARRWAWGNDAHCGYSTMTSEGKRVVQAPPCDTTRPVDSRQQKHTSSPEGIRGLNGNLWEWVADVYVPGSGPAAPAPPDVGDDALRVQRGGSYLDPEPLWIRSAARVGVAPDARLEDVGARCVWTR